jgi:hypothetical protein
MSKSTTNRSSAIVSNLVERSTSVWKCVKNKQTNEFTFIYTYYIRIEREIEFRQRSLPSIFFPSHYSTITLWFKDVYSGLLKASLNKSRTVFQDVFFLLVLGPKFWTHFYSIKWLLYSHDVIFRDPITQIIQGEEYRIRKSPYYAIFSRLLLLPLSWLQIFSSTACSQISLV